MKNNLRVDCCVVGMGPAGIGAALALGNTGTSFICIDAGRLEHDRNCSALQHNLCSKEYPCSIIGGFGGCSLLSGGKISLYPAGSKFGELLGSVDEAKRQLNLAKEKWCSHINHQKISHELVDIELSRQGFEQMGFRYKYYETHQFSEKEIRDSFEIIRPKIQRYADILSNSKLNNVVFANNRYFLYCNNLTTEFTIEAKNVIFAPGRLGRETLKLANQSLNLGAKPSRLDVGVRLEMPTELIANLIGNHGDLKLTFNNARTYCVCKGGRVASYYLEGIRFTEGLCDSTQQTNNTNLAILVRLDPSEHNEVVFSEIKKQSIEHFKGFPVFQSLNDYLGKSQNDTGKENCVQKQLSIAIAGNINLLFPEKIGQEIKQSVVYFLEKTIPKKYWSQIKVYGPEVDFNGLVFPIHCDFSVKSGVYVIGSATGHFRGILQSFCSGTICGESLLNNGDVNNDEKTN